MQLEGLLFPFINYVNIADWYLESKDECILGFVQQFIQIYVNKVSRIPNE